MSLSSSLRSFARLVERHRVPCVAGALLYCIIAAYLTSHITLAQDTRALLADADPVIADQLDAISRFTGIDQMLVMVEGTDATAESVTVAARALARRTEANPAFGSAFFEQSYTGVDSILAPLHAHRFLLDPRNIESLLQPKALKERFRTLHAKLLGPEGLVRKKQLVADPFETWPAVLGQLDTAPGLNELEVRAGQLWSAKRNAALVVLTPDGHAMSGEAAHRVMFALDEVIAEIQPDHPGVLFRPVGGHRYAYDAEQTVRHDINLAFGLTGISVLLIFVVFFRRARLLWVAVPPLVMGVLTAGAAAGSLGLAGTGVHGIVFAFVGATAGLSIDYTIHLVVAAHSTEQEIPEAIAALGPSLALAAASTAAALVVLGTSDVNAIAHMGLLGGAAVFGALLGNGVWVPVILPMLRSGPGSLSARQWMWPARFAERFRLPLGVLTAMVVVAGPLAATGITLDGNIRNLNTPSDALAADEAALYSAFGDPGSSALVLVRGRDVAGAMLLTEQVRSTLVNDESRRLLSPSVLAPSPGTSQARRTAWCANLPDTSARIVRAAAAAGFTPQAFSGLSTELRDLCGAPPEPLAARGLQAFTSLTKQPVRHDADGHVVIATTFEAPAEEMGPLSASLEALGSVTVIHRAALNERLVALVGTEFQRLLLWSLLSVAVLLLVGLRNPKDVALALLPPAVGIVGTLAVLSVAGVPLNLTNLVVFPLIAGLGIDYGVLMTTASPGDTAERAFSVGVAAATTLAGFGTLAIARYHAIATIGQTLVLAVVIGGAAAVLLIPALRRSG